MTIHMGTTSIESSRTAGDIQDVLRRAGCSKIGFTYDGPEPTAVEFCVRVGDQDVWFRLPIRPEKVYAILKAPRDQKARREQAKRTAWRLVLRWIQAQVALIETEQVKVAEVFLPYAVTPDGQTMFESMERKWLALPPMENRKDHA